MYDARAVANAMLDAAHRHGMALSDLKLQKLLYFVHGQFLIETGKTLGMGGLRRSWLTAFRGPFVAASMRVASRDEPFIVTLPS